MNYLVLTDNSELPLEYEKYIISDAANVNAIEWCEQHHAKYTVLPRNWEDNLSYEKDLQYLEDVQQKLINYLTKSLNTYHQTSYSFEQWYVVLGQWTVNFLSIFYDKFLKFKEICDLQIECECDLYEADNADIPLDYMEFNGWIQEDDYHLYLFSFIYWQFEELHEWVKVRKIDSCIKKREQLIPCKCGKKEKIYRFFFETYKKITGKMDEIVITDAYHYLPFSVKFGAAIRSVGYMSIYESYYGRRRFQLNSAIDYQWRLSQDVVEDDDIFLNIVFRCVYKLLPSVHVENFEKLFCLVREEYKYAFNAKKVIYDYSGMTSNEIHKAYLMVMKGKGAKLYDMQHGGSYGIDYSFHHDTEYRICDVFYSWGWKLENKLCEFQPMPVHKIMINNRNYQSGSKKILYLGYARQKYMLSLQEYSINVDIEKEGEIEFFKSLSLKVKKNLVVRLYKRNFGWWNTEESLGKTVEGLTFDLGVHSATNLNKNYYEAVMSSRLLVAPELSTTAIEALALGVPILVKHKLEGIECEAYEDLQELKKVGVLVETWEALNYSLEQIYDSVEDWWHEPQRKAVIETFKKKYALTEKNARKIWLDKILEV